MIHLDRFEQRWTIRTSQLISNSEQPAHRLFPGCEGVSTPGDCWEIGDYRLWRGTNRDTIYFVAREPLLGRTPDGRRAALVSRSVRPAAGRSTALGGSAQLTPTLFPSCSEAELQRLDSEWRRVVLHHSPTGSENPRFLPLPTRDQYFQVILDPAMGTGSAVAPGDTLAVQLTARGVEEWARALCEQAPVSGSVYGTYRYRRLLPEASGTVIIHGTRVFTHLAQYLRPTGDGTIAGTTEEVRTAWESAARSGAIEVTLNNTPSLEAETCQAALVEQFLRLAREQLLETLFAPNPPAGTGPIAVLRWRSLADADDLELTVRVKGWNWVTATTTAPLSRILAPLDATYLEETEVAEQAGGPSAFGLH